MKKKRVIIGISVAAVLAACAIVLGVVFGVRAKKPTHEHEFDYNSITWEWEGSEAQASVQCACGETLVLQTEISQKTILPATCEDVGQELFTAKFTANGVEYSDEKQVELPALGHDFDYTAILWSWNEDTPTASANIPCKRGEHTLTLTPEIDEEILLEPACESEGSALYTARLVSGEEEYTDTSLRKLIALGHDYAAEFKWEDDLSAATLYLTCKRACGKAPYSERIASTFKHKDATCEENGSDTYTVQTIYDGKPFNEAYVKSISALNHDYDYTTVEWLWQGREAKAVIKCKRDSNHSMQAATEMKEEVLKQPTCEEEGEGRYTAVFQREGNRFTDEKILPIPTVAHEYDFAEAVWEWDGTQSAGAIVHCKRNPDHTQKVLAEITMMITVEPSCEQKGIMEYTATVTDANGQEYTDVVQMELFGGTHVYREAVFLNNKSHELLCTKCGHEELEAHENDEDKICTVCGVSTWLYYIYRVEDKAYSAWGAESSNDITDNVVKRIVFPNYYYDEYSQNGFFPVTMVSHFKDCSALEQIVLPEHLKRIHGGAFQDCTSLGEISLPSTLTDIGSGAFQGCTSLGEISLPSTLTDIGSDAFLNCSLLSIDNLPSSLQYIGESAFYGCRSLTEITIPSGVSEISMSAFSGCRRLTSVTFESGVKTIGDHAFYGCTKLKTLSFGATVESIGTHAFYGCDALERVKLSSGLKSIGKYAFAYCTALKQVELPSGLKSIAEYAFWHCTALKTIFIPRSVETMGSYVFEMTENLTIYCEAPAKPTDWEYDWNASQTVFWAFDYSVDDGYVTVID